MPPKGCRRLRRYRSHGQQARRQGEKLAYANFVIDLSTPARKFNFLPRAMFDTAIQRGPRTCRRSPFLDDFGRRSQTCSGFVIERYLLARTMPLNIRPVHSPVWRVLLQNRAHDTPQKKKHHYIYIYI